VWTTYCFITYLTALPDIAVLDDEKRNEQHIISSVPNFLKVFEKIVRILRILQFCEHQMSRKHSEYTYVRITAWAKSLYVSIMELVIWSLDTSKQSNYSICTVRFKTTSSAHTVYQCVVSLWTLRVYLCNGHFEVGLNF